MLSKCNRCGEPYEPVPGNLYYCDKHRPPMNYDIDRCIQDLEPIFDRVYQCKETGKYILGFCDYRNRRVGFSDGAIRTTKQASKMYDFIKKIPPTRAKRPEIRERYRLDHLPKNSPIREKMERNK